MQVEWQISEADKVLVQEFICQQADNPFVRARKTVNLSSSKPGVDRERFWRQMASMRLTSVQRSGPDSHVARFIRTSPFALSYELVRASNDRAGFISNALRRAGGIRFVDKIAVDLEANLRLLEGGEWERALEHCNRLAHSATREIERRVAEYIRETFRGFGPKQSRNLLQALGLTRYEIPIDSRVTDWLNDFGFPDKLSAAALADPSYYDFVSEGIQALCAKCNVFPCILDAAIFAFRDGDGWKDENIV